MALISNIKHQYTNIVGIAVYIYVLILKYRTCSQIFNNYTMSSSRI